MIDTLFIEKSKNIKMYLSLPGYKGLQGTGKVLFYEYSCFYIYFMY